MNELNATSKWIAIWLRRIACVFLLRSEVTGRGFVVGTSLRVVRLVITQSDFDPKHHGGLPDLDHCLLCLWIVDSNTRGAARLVHVCAARGIAWLRLSFKVAHVSAGFCFHRHSIFPD